MAMTAGSSSCHHSAGRKNLSSPWAQVVRGELEAPSDSDQPVSPMRQTSNIATIGSPVSPPLSLTHDGHHAGEGLIRYNGNADSFSIKVPAWSKPSSGSGTIVEPAVMGDALAWPPLSEANRLSPKVQSADPPAANGSNSGFQALVVVVNSPGKPAPDTNHVNPISVQDHMSPSCHKLTKHGTNNSNSNASTGFVQNNSTNPAPPVVPSPPPFPILVGPNGYENFITPMIDPFVNQPSKGNTWEGRPGFMHQPHAMSDHRSSSRRGNFVSRPRSYGTLHRGGHGGRHDYDRGNYRGNRDVNMSTQRTSHSDRGGFVRTPPSNAAPFFPLHGVRPFGLGPFPDFYYAGMHMEPYRAGGSFLPSAAPAPLPVLITLPDDLSSPILKQINYYFSDYNLLKDDYLKKQMDVEGWVHISLIANFPRVKSLTTDDKLILQIMKSSTIVEVQGEKLRRRDEWKKWLVPPTTTIQVYSENGSPSSTHSAIADSLQKMTVEETDSITITAPDNYI